jgi:hypothetical protein
VISSSEDSALASRTGDPQNDLSGDDEEGAAVDDRDGVDAMDIDIDKGETDGDGGALPLL